MKKTLLSMILMLVLGTAQTWAQWEAETRISRVLVWNNDGKYNVFKCSDHPEVTVDSLFLSISVGASTVLQFPADEVRKFTFDDEQMTPVEQVNKQALFDILPDAILVSDLPKGSAVLVYDANGRLRSKAKVSDGQARVNTSALRRGVYVVKAGNTNFKFLKR